MTKPKEIEAWAVQSPKGIVQISTVAQTDEESIECFLDAVTKASLEHEPWFVYHNRGYRVIEVKIVPLTEE
jgi:predicted transposase YdaD